MGETLSSNACDSSARGTRRLPRPVQYDHVALLGASPEPRDPLTLELKSGTRSAAAHSHPAGKSVQQFQNGAITSPKPGRASGAGAVPRCLRSRSDMRKFWTSPIRNTQWRSDRYCPRPISAPLPHGRQRASGDAPLF